MTLINLKKLYPFYGKDVWIEVSQEVAEAILQQEREEKAYLRKLYRYRAHYSLDRADGLVYTLLCAPLTTEEALEQQMIHEALEQALLSLPEKQQRRIIAHFFDRMSKAQIAKLEGVSRKTIQVSIQKGLEHLAKKLNLC